MDIRHFLLIPDDVTEKRVYSATLLIVAPIKTKQGENIRVCCQLHNLSSHGTC